MNTQVDLKQLAKDIRGNLVFHSNMIHEHEAESMMPLIFMPLMLMTSEALDNLDSQDPWILYEYLDKAGIKAINGYPMFISFKWLNKEQWIEVLSIIDKLDAAEKAALDA